MKKKLYYISFDWKSLLGDIDVDFPEEVPVYGIEGSDVELGEVIEGFRKLISSGKKKKYLNDYEEFIVQVCVKYADTIAASGRHEAAIILLKKFLKFFSGNGLLNLKLSQFYFEAAFPVESEKYIKKALKLEPEETMILTFAGIINASTGNPEKAEKYWKQAVKIDPEFRKAWLNLTNLYNYEGKFKKNLNLLDKHSHLLDYPEIANQMGIAYASTKRFNKAIKLFEKARSESEIEIPYLDFNLAQAYMDARKWKKALDLYQDIYKRMRNTKARETLEERINYLNRQISEPKKGHRLSGKGKKTFSITQIAKEEEYYLQIMKSIEKLKQEAAENPENPWVYYNLGNLYAQLGKFEEAAEQLKKSLDMNEENALVWHTLGLVYLELEQEEDALNAIQHAVICRPGNDIMAIYQKMNFNMSLPYFNLGDIYIARKKYREALHAFEKGLEIDARSFLAHYKAGTIYEKMKKYKIAEEAYRKALVLNEGFLETYLSLGKLLLKTSRVPEGITVLRKLLIIAPDSEEAVKAMKVLNKYG